MPDIVFKPKETEPTPWERAKYTQEQAMGVHKQLQQAGGSFNFNRFIREFANPLIEAYNVKAKAQGLPIADRKWFQILHAIEGHAVKPKDFYTKYRTTLQPQMFPGDLTKATKAYDLFLSGLTDVPLAISGPVSGMLSHEFGHGQTYKADPAIPIASQRPFGVETGQEVERLINEAVASYKGFQTAWKAWERYGIPNKAWGAWYGFPTYLANITEQQFGEAMKRLKGMESKYPGISDQVHKTLYEYSKYIEPVMYNIPGEFWSIEEKEALKRFLKERNAPYRETVPDEKTRLQHLRRQPYVMRDDPRRTDMDRMAKTIMGLLLPLSKRAEFTQLPLSKRADETPVIPIGREHAKHEINKIREENLRKIKEMGLDKPLEYPEKHTFFGEQFLPGDIIVAKEELEKPWLVLKRTENKRLGVAYTVRSLEENLIWAKSVARGMKGGYMLNLPESEWDVPGKGLPPIGPKIVEEPPKRLSKQQQIEEENKQQLSRLNFRERAQEELNRKKWFKLIPLAKKLIERLEPLSKGQDTFEHPNLELKHLEEQVTQGYRARLVHQFENAIREAYWALRGIPTQEGWKRLREKHDKERKTTTIG